MFNKNKGLHVHLRYISCYGVLPHALLFAVTEKRTAVFYDSCETGNFLHMCLRLCLGAFRT